MVKKAMVVLALVLSGCGFARAGGERPEPSRKDRVVKSDAEWKASLTAEEYRILRDAGTERAFTGDYWDDHGPGVYACAGCGLELFASDHKFDSGTGWPSYFEPIAKDRVNEHTDVSFGMVRTELTCARCGGHLGHVFTDGPKPTGLRYCINGNVLDKKPVASAKPEAEKPRR